MIVFVAVAVIALAAAAEVKSSRQWLVWAIPALAAFGLSIGREPSVVFLGLFAAATVILGAAAALGRIPSSCFALLAASDLFLALAVSAEQRATASWALPPADGWTPFAAALVGLATIIRLGSIRTEGRPATASRPRRLRGVRGFWRAPFVSTGGGYPSGPPLVGWCQGAALAWWAGPGAAGVLVVGGLALWAISAFGRRKEGLHYLMVAGGLIALVSAAGGSTTAIAVAALAGVAGFMGERTVSTFALALAPLSLATSVIIPFGTPALLAAIVLPAAALAAGPHLTPPPEPASPAGARLVAWAAAVSGIFLLDAAGIVWLMLATGAAATAVYRLTRPSPVEVAAFAAGPESLTPAPARSWPLVIAGWALMAMAILVGASLALYGFGTSFL